MTDPMTVEIDKKKALMEIKKSWMNELQGILNSPRVAEMTFHVPKVDKDMEFITPGAMAGALRVSQRTTYRDCRESLADTG